jgi:hypothetical protein
MSVQSFYDVTEALEWLAGNGFQPRSNSDVRFFSARYEATLLGNSVLVSRRRYLSGGFR